MTRTLPHAILFAALAVATLAPSATAAEHATAKVVGGNGQPLGTLALAQTAGGVLIRGALSGLPPGSHAFHIHAVGKCEPPFASAGGHFNPAHRSHGFESAEGGHAGDMPNIHVPASGCVTVETVNDRVTLADGKPNSLMGGAGTALVIHAGADDYRSDPAGNAGGRIACGVIAP
jgi:superoxide dismutase, Cu-Zn family